MPKKKPQPVPPVAEREKAGLSDTLTYPRVVNRCQSCGLEGLIGSDLSGFQEHDPNDRPMHRLVLLCESCEKRHIDAHPRLYRKMPPNTPWPGAMTICLGCRFSVNLDCTSKLLRANGGPGLPVYIEAPIRAHVNYGGGRGEFMSIYKSPATECDGREES